MLQTMLICDIMYTNAVEYSCLGAYNQVPENLLAKVKGEITSCFMTFDTAGGCTT